jgi:glycosyltransferase involved in cell wall biosynthesis
VKVSQILCAAGPVDAVTNQALSWRSEFQRWGWEGRVFSARAAQEVARREVRPLRELDQDADVVLLHYSGYGRDLEPIFEGPARVLLLYHNVTPEEWFWPYEPVEAVVCRLGREQLQELAGRADQLAGVSDYNAAELTTLSGRPAAVIPVFFDAARLGPPGPVNGSGSPGSRSPTVLFVGRLAPHKRQDLVIRSFAHLLDRRPEARLVLVGTPLSPGYGHELRRLAERLAPGAVTFETGLSMHELAERYRAADVFLCLSEHEGFCIPLLEAFHFGLPVIARDAAAVGEVVGEAGVLLESADGPRTVAELLDIVLGDDELREELRRRGRARLTVFDPSRVAQDMRRALTDLTQA